jgi:hypothetical protein
MHTRTAHIHPTEISWVLAKLIEKNVEAFKVEDDRSGTGTWAVIVDGDRVPAGVFRQSVGRKTSVTVERF